MKASEPLALVRPDGTTVTLPNSFLLDVSPVERAYISSGDHSSLSIGELKIAKNPRRMRTQTDQDIDFDQKHQICHFKKILSNRCVSISPEYLTKNTGARYARVMKEKEASALMEHDEAIDSIGGVEAKSPESARRKPDNEFQKEEKKKAFESLLSRLTKSGPPPKFDLSKASLHERPSAQPPSTAEISRPRSAHSDKDSGYDTESPVKKLNPAASEFNSGRPLIVHGDSPVASEFRKSAPMIVHGDWKNLSKNINLPRLHINTTFPPEQGTAPAPAPMPAGLPPMKPFGTPFDYNNGMNMHNNDMNMHGFDASFPTNGQGSGDFSAPFPPMMLPPPQRDGMHNNPMGYSQMPAFHPPAAQQHFGSFNGAPPNMMPQFPGMPPMPPMSMEHQAPPMFNGGNHFNTFPHCGPPPLPLQQAQFPPQGQFMNGHPPPPGLAPPMPQPDMRPPMAPVGLGPATLPPAPAHPIMPHPNPATSTTINPAVVPVVPVPAAPVVVAPPHFPVTKKPRDNDPYKQQKYEEYLEWRKMYEPGFHLAAKQRQVNRFIRNNHQRGARSEDLGGGGSAFGGY